MVAHRVRVSRCHTGGRSSRRRVTLPVTKCPVDETTLCLPPIPWVHQETGQAATEQTYCDRLVQDMPFLTGLGRLSEQQVDRIILQLNRYYPQILSNKDAEKVPRNLRLLFHPFPLWAGRSGGQDSLEFRNPKVSLRVRLCDLLGHLQRSGERDCQEFYRALYIHAQPLHSCLPSRHALRPVAFLTCLGLAAGLALLVYCCPPDPKVLPGARRVLGFSPVIVDRHVSRFLLAFLTDDLGGL
ncbi:caspase recruitment domain-containing protein 19 isoform X8 [Lagenorhynchus albirostris]|uniref:caspase recruitment domain-containing protein 19 isoform X8 n=1 Tax=Lagenorhynchus albirostris TaxID=27610 RepID=UPI0028E74DE2|nr:caspase recruitment domain-containing protein 19 isoform X8 [Lagenorhynchus albirostris]